VQAGADAWQGSRERVVGEGRGEEEREWRNVGVMPLALLGDGGIVSDRGGGRGGLGSRRLLRHTLLPHETFDRLKLVLMVSEDNYGKALKNEEQYIFRLASYYTAFVYYTLVLSCRSDLRIVCVSYLSSILYLCFQTSMRVLPLL
jgi:hypothetical protein